MALEIYPSITVSGSEIKSSIVDETVLNAVRLNNINDRVFYGNGVPAHFLEIDNQFLEESGYTVFSNDDIQLAYTYRYSDGYRYYGFNITGHGAAGSMEYGYSLGPLDANSLVFIVDHTAQQAQLLVLQKQGNWGTVSEIVPGTLSGYLYDFLIEHETKVYNWAAWDQISGNNGQYRCQLSKLTDTALEDISPQISQPATIFERLSTRSSIWSIIQNAQLGEKKTVMWSGRNWCTMTMTAGGVGGNYVLTFKFYNPNMSETTPFYTYTDYIVYSPSSPDVNTDSNILLSFAYDNTQQAAVFLPVVYRAGGLAEGYMWGVSSQNMPTDDQLLYLYLWLTESGAGTPEYPYDTGTEDNGGNPGGPQPGDHMAQPGVPTLSGMSSKMFTVYCPTEEQLEDIAEYLWSDNVITNIRKYFNNFSDNIIALYVLPHQPANLPTKNFTVGNLQSDTITGVKYVTSRFVDVDMGSVTVKTTYDSYLDFSPFTRFEIYLPGVGMQTLSADDIMCPTDPDTGTLNPVEESTISVKYTLDLMTGLLVAFVFVNGEMRYQFPGKIGYSIPITGENYTRMVTGAISAMAGLVGAAATGGLTAPLAAGGVAAAVSGTVNAMKPDVHRSGNLSGDVSMMSEESPYLIYHRPNKPLLENQERYTGFPSYKSGALSEFSGLTQVIDAHIEGISCTEAERAEILNLLKSGVIL